MARITGINSGLDVDALVKASMTTYQSKIDKEAQNKKVLEYQQEQYKKIISDAANFYDKYFDILKTGNLMSTNSYQSVSFKSGDDTKVTAKGFAGASVSDYKVATTQLASKATASFKSGELLKDSKLGIKIDGKDPIVVVINDTGDKKADMKIAVNSLNEKLNAAGIDVSAKYSEFSDSIILESGKMGESVSFEAGVNGNYNPYVGKNAKGIITKDKEIYAIDQASNVLTVDNVQFSFKAASTSTTNSTTASKIEDLVHLTSEKGITKKSYDGKIETKVSENGKEITTTKTEGTEKTTTVTKILDNGETTITTTIMNNETKSGEKVTETVVGTDGTVIKTIKEGTDKDNLQSISTETYSSVSLAGSTDSTALKDKIVSFVNDYNTLLSSINTKIYETRDKDYMPLSDDQKKEMTDDQIEKWETKAQTGLIRKDMDLERITTAMKSAMSTVISGSGLTLESIGIKPVANYAEKNGMFTVDEATLTQALEKNAGNIKDLFTRAASGNDKGGIFTQLAATLKSEFKSSTASLSKKAGIDGTSTQYSNTLTKSIAKKKTLIEKLNDKFSVKETALYKKYSALETALEKLNSQQASLSSMLGTS